MKRLWLVLAFCLSLTGVALAQGGMGPGPGTVHSTGAAYAGPGDVSINGSTNNWYVWYSCARVYNAASASTSTNLCDLVDSAAPTVVICTLRGTTSGLVDLSAYCPGSVTPAAKCAAATGGVCNISQVYDQTGNARPVVQVTAANQPFLAFSALSSLPAIQCTAANCVLQTAGTFTIAQPITQSGVYIQPTNNGFDAPFIGQPTVPTHIGASANVNQARINAGAIVDVTATSNVWHALQGLLSGAGNNCALNVDGTDTASLNCGTNSYSAINIRVMRGNALQLVGSITEAGMLAVTSTPTERGNIRLNQKAVYTTLP